MPTDTLFARIISPKEVCEKSVEVLATISLSLCGLLRHAGLLFYLKGAYSAYMHKDWAKFMALIFPETCPASRCCSALASDRGHSD